MINWNVDLGSLLQVGGFLGTVIYVAATVRSDVRLVKTDISDIKLELKTLREVVTMQATQTVRLDLMSKRLDKLDDDYRMLRQGEGWVLPFPTSGRGGAK